MLWSEHRYSTLMTKNLEENDEVTLIGYARVSTADQNLEMQIEALKRYGVLEEHIYSESMSGVKKNRPALAAALRQLREGDTLVVWKLDRIARSINNLLDIMKDLEDKGIKFRSITEGVETETPTGKMILIVMGALAQFERDLIVERTRAGVAAAKERGVKFGREYKLNPGDMPAVWKLANREHKTRKWIAKRYGVSENTISRLSLIHI